MIKEFIAKILALDNQPLIDNNTKLQSELNASKHNNELLRKEYNNLLLEKNEKYDALKHEYQKLLNKEKLNILDLKDWYENKYDSRAWNYNFDGTKKQDSKNSLKDSISHANDLTAFAKKLISLYALKTDSKPSKIVECVLKYFMKSKHWTYAFDKDYYKLADYWQKAGESLLRRKGDCDDLAILMHNTVYYLLKELGLQKHYWRIKIACGSLVGYGGHAFNIWLHDDGEWYVVESTYDLGNSYKKTWLKTPIKNNNLYRDFWGFVRKDKSWLGRLSSLEPYK